jgi:hypothetical protein
MNSSLLIAVDRGALKAYSVEHPRNREAMPRLLETFQIADAHQRYQDKVTDQAGAFPSGGTGGQGNSIAERTTLDAENEERILRQLGQHITGLLNQYRPEHWSFAAASEINEAILQNLSPDLRARLERNIPKDLVKTDPENILGYFVTPPSGTE